MTDLSEFSEVPDDARAHYVDGHPRATNELNRQSTSTWVCDFCHGFGSSPKPILPKGWELMFSRRDPWWGEIHLVRCAACVAGGVDRCAR